jgi:pheromone shutdown protein TraB
MSISEKIKLVLSGVGGLFVSKKRVESELEKIEKDFDMYVTQIGEKFPTIKKTLIDDRNNYMANNIEKLSENHEKIVACVGDGHIPGLSVILKGKNLDFNTVRLSEIRKKKQVSLDSSEAHFSIEHKNQ